MDDAFIVAARVWCHEDARNMTVDPDLLELFAKILRQVGDKDAMRGWVKNPPPEISLLDIEIVGSSDMFRTAERTKKREGE